MKNKNVEELEKLEADLDFRLKVIKNKCITYFKMKKLNQGIWAYLEKKDINEQIDHLKWYLSLIK